MLPIVRRLQLHKVLGIFVAVVLATLSLLHQHALIPDEASPAPCVVCAFGADVAVTAPEIVAPVALAYVLPDESAAQLLSHSFVAVPSRAPPAA